MSDVFDRLKNRQRPIVQTRDTSIQSKPDEVGKDEMTKVSHSEIANSSNLIVDHQPHQDEEIEISRRTVRLDMDIDKKLDSLCTTQKITRDTFIESAFILCSMNKEFMGEVIKEARQRYDQRKQIGEKRKLKTMTNKLTP
jgi:hypothetical protein